MESNDAGRKAAADLTNEEVVQLASSRGMKVTPIPASEKPICKPLDPEEEKRIKEIFNRYDLDGSGVINLGELSKLFKDLGAPMTDEEVAKTMAELDKNGEYSCNFEEFCAFWTSKPGLGGYSSMALQFMKAKLKLMSGMNNMKAGKAAMNLKRVRSGPPLDAGEFAVRVGGDFSPSLVGCEPKMEIKASLQKIDQAGAAPETFDTTFVLAATSSDAAKSALDAIQPCLPAFEDAPFRVAVSQSEHTVIIKICLPAEVADTSLVEMSKNLATAAKSCKANLSWSKDFDDVMKAPNGPLHALLGACKIDGEAVISAGNVLSIIEPEGDGGCGDDPVWNATKSSFQLLAGSEINVSLGYFEGQVKPLLSLLKNLLLQDKARMGEGMAALFGNLPDVSLHQARDAMLKGMMMDPQGDNPSPPQEALDMMNCVRTLPEFITGIDSLTISGLPGFDVSLTFQNFNPFPLIAYMIEPITSMVKMVPKRLLKAGLAKKLSPEEEAKLMDAFKKFDKDGSGQIDLSELKAMIVELGGSISDDDAQQAMKQLDQNGQGTCNFEEFKTFWSSKSGLGGYSSMALKFLKMKLQVDGFVGMGKRMFTRMRKPVNEADNTSVKLCCVATPEMEAYKGHRMSASLGMKALESDGTFTPPKTLVRLLANSEEAASQVVSKANSMMEKVKELGMLPVLPAISQDGDKVVICMQPPDEMFEELRATLLENDEMSQPRQAAIEMSKACQVFSVEIGCATNWDDWISQPDTPLEDLFQGAQGEVSVSMTPQGKQAFLSNLPDMGAPTTLAKALIRAFAGAEVKLCQGFRSKVIKQLISIMTTTMPFMADMVSEPGKLTTATGLRDIMQTMTEQMMCPMLSEMPPEAMPLPPRECLEYAQCVLDSMKSIESVTSEMSMAPTARDQCTRVQMKLTALDMNLFSAANFLLCPTIKAMSDALPATNDEANNGIAL